MSTSIDGAPPSVTPGPDEDEPADDDPADDPAEGSAGAGSSGTGSSWVQEEMRRRMAERRSGAGGRHARRDPAGEPPGVSHVPRHSVATPGPGAPAPAPIGGPSMPPSGVPAARRRRPGGDDSWSGPGEEERPGGRRPPRAYRPGTRGSASDAPAVFGGPGFVEGAVRPVPPQPAPRPPDEFGGPDFAASALRGDLDDLDDRSGSTVIARGPLAPPPATPPPADVLPPARPGPAARPPARPAARRPRPPPFPPPPVQPLPVPSPPVPSPLVQAPPVLPPPVLDAPVLNDPLLAPPRPARPVDETDLWASDPRGLVRDPADRLDLTGPVQRIEVDHYRDDDEDDGDLLSDPDDEGVLWSATMSPVAEDGTATAAPSLPGDVEVPEPRAAEPGEPVTDTGIPLRRVKVTLSERRNQAHPVRTVVDIQEGGAVGELLRSNLIGSQLTVALRFALFAALTLGLLPLAFAVFPEIGRTEVFGLRLPWLLLGVLVYPFLLGLGWWHTRTAERVEQNFADHVQD
ncbi:hypothetical protein [Pseudonocardia broussonetiae]|uniref:DUF485 domain-containing protein n=1 Tax=Pseudonocardia broussonetiae TaxID=2736640 RepID=A0A6M6JDK1_9PSEU|nr:hypothetical protein [Pseudonocardia broussonetiae]QJY45656.1 hypothetical protein HOP40_07455 [Pseudonocardia broussonetiae]